MCHFSVSNSFFSIVTVHQNQLWELFVYKTFIHSLLLLLVITIQINIFCNCFHLDQIFAFTLCTKMLYIINVVICIEHF